jgi:hypothetical protein
MGDVCVLGEHMQLVITASGTATGLKVRVDGCPRCKRPLHLDHVGVVEEDGEFLDLNAVTFAQSLHLANCRG